VSPGLRASDEDRELTAAALREHFAAGRLSQDELGERLEQAYGATDRAHLRALTADLPALPVSSAAQQAELADRRAHLRRRLLQESGGALGAFVICSVIWVAAGASGAFWPVWILLVALIPLARGGWSLYGPAPDLDRVERELHQRASRAEHRAARDEARAARREARRGRRS